MCISKTLAGNREIVFGVQDEFKEQCGFPLDVGHR